MIHFSPCLEIFFNDLSFPERIRKISEIGYKYYEFWSWWDKNTNELEQALGKYPVQCAGFCTKFVSLVDPGKRNEYLDGLGQTIEVAQRLKAKIIISQVGNEIPGVSREIQTVNLIEGLRGATKLLEGTDQVLAIEPLNLLFDHSGYFLSRSDEAFLISRAVNSKHIKFLFDIYHQQISEGNLTPNIRNYISEIAHFHVADHPGRHEIGTGEINYSNIFKTIAELDYSGCIGIELWPLNKDHSLVLKSILEYNQPI